MHKKGEHSVLIKSTGHEKDKITVALAAMADGKKLPPFVVLKGVRPPASKDVPTGVKVCMTGNGWMNELASKTWIQKIWRCSTPDNHRKLLVWDAFRAHKCPAVKEMVSDRVVGNSDVAMIPGGCTSLLQPADLSWNKPFKDHLREAWDDWLINGEHTFTKGKNMRKPTISLMLQWIVEAWESLSTDIIIRSFKKPGISNAMDGTEDDMLWIGDEDDDENEELTFPGFHQEQEEQAASVAAAVQEATETAITDMMTDHSDQDEDGEDEDESYDRHHDHGAYYYDDVSSDGNATDKE